MTENEARLMFCPFATTVCINQDLEGNNYFTQASRSLDEGEREDLKCIASDCMAWRILYDNNPFDEEIEVGGYCGLAGKP